METIYPPVGIAHITDQLSDLLQDRVTNKAQIKSACIMQPKSDPHFGTMIVVMTTYALAEYLQKEFDAEVQVLVDALENSPYEKFEKNGRLYSLCLSHKMIDGKPASKHFMQPVKSLMDWLESETDVEGRIRWYEEIQAQRQFRSGLTEILERKEDFKPIFAPSERHLRIRPVCTKCGIVDKRSESVEYNRNKKTLVSECPNCGRFETHLDDREKVIGANTPIRTILRSYAFANKENESMIIVNGKDWSGVWMQRVYHDALAELNCAGTEVPMNIFAPLILDKTGAKLSKTIYLESDAYDKIDSAWLSAPAFRERFGESGLKRLFQEVTSWIEDPKRLFRNYSLAYFQSLFQ